MAHYAGLAGEVDNGASVTGIKSWSLDYVVDMLETTDFGDSGKKTYVAGLSGWSGSFEGYKDGAPIAIGTSITITLKETQTATQKWTGTAFISAVHSNTSVDGVVTYSYDFQGTGTLTVPTA